MVQSEHMSLHQQNPCQGERLLFRLEAAVS